MVIITGSMLIGGALIVGGIAATGFVAQQVGQILFQQGQNRQFDTWDEVSDALLRAGRPDLAQELAIETSGAFGASQAEPQSGIEGILGDVRQILPLAILGYVAIKGFK